MAHDLQKIAQEDQLVVYAVRGNFSKFCDDFNRRLSFALSHEAPGIIEFLDVVLSQPEVRGELPANVVSVYRNLLKHAQAQLMFVR